MFCTQKDLNRFAKMVILNEKTISSTSLNNVLNRYCVK